MCIYISHAHTHTRKSRREHIVIRRPQQRAHLQLGGRVLWHGRGRRRRGCWKVSNCTLSAAAASERPAPRLAAVGVSACTCSSSSTLRMQNSSSGKACQSLKLCACVKSKQECSRTGWYQNALRTLDHCGKWRGTHACTHARPDSDEIQACN